MTRPRIRVVLAGFVVGLVLVTVVSGAIAYVTVLHSPARTYAATFDSNLVHSQKLLGPLVVADPALRELMLEATGKAYAEGGWPAASRMFHALANSEMGAYAGDETTLACGAAWRDVLRSLADQPASCRAYLDHHFDAPGVRQAMHPAQAPCDTAQADGAKQRRTRTTPDILTDGEYSRIYATIVARLTPAERAALQGGGGDDGLACRAGMRRDDGVAALPPDLQARYLRTELRFTGRRPLTPPLPIAPPPPEYHCAPPGTVFALSTESSSDGLPVTWIAREQRGWDCPVFSSGAGERSVWGGDAGNPLRLLWPLAVGKTASAPDIPTEPGRATSYRVAADEAYWLPWGRVRAFAIAEDVTEGPARRYRITRYWSPELGVQIGQEAEALTGTLPNTIVSNWQLIGRQDPIGDRGARLGRAAAADDIRFALARAEAVHPDLYWYADRGTVLGRAEAAIAALPDPVPAMDLYLALAQVLSLLGDGHVSLGRPPGSHGDVLTSYERFGGKLLAVGVAPAAGGLRVFWGGKTGLAGGDVIATINGQDAGALFERGVSLLPGEPAFRRRIAETAFGWTSWDLGVSAPFELTGVFGHVPGRLKVSGEAIPMPSAQKPDDDGGITLRDLPDGAFLITFSRMTATETLFRQRLSAIFGQIAAAHATGLVIDIRGNTGGSIGLGAVLLDYVSDKPRRGFARRVLRASPECRAYFGAKYAGNFLAREIGEMADGDTRSWDVPTQTGAANPLRFAGPVAVLIGPGTFSAANILANEIADEHLATLIGRDTAEIPNNFANACPLTLPNSQMELWVPSTYFVRANGDAGNREDVHPDIVVPRAEDGSDGDVDLEAARRWLKTAP